MATIQRSLLIEAPNSVVFDFWNNFERYPAFMEDVSRVSVVGDVMTWDRVRNGDTLPVQVRVVERVDRRKLAWECTEGAERGAVLTFAPLEGDATWFTYTLDYDADAAPEHGDIAGRLAATSRRLDRELRQARELIEGVHAERLQEAKEANRC